MGLSLTLFNVMYLKSINVMNLKVYFIVLMVLVSLVLPQKRWIVCAVTVKGVSATQEEPVLCRYEE